MRDSYISPTRNGGIEGGPGRPRRPTVVDWGRYTTLRHHTGEGPTSMAAVRNPPTASGGLRRPPAALALVRGDGDQGGLDAALDRLLGHDALLHVAAGGRLELHLQEHLFDDRAQAAGAGLALQGLVGHGIQRVAREHE